jgi:ABC-type amino acid transport substrate-binding protein
MCRTPTLGVVLILIASVLVAGFLTAGVAQGEALRVGVSPDYPPLIFKRDGAYVGADADLALELGRALHRPVEFVPVAWDKQIPALLAGETDIIISGMSVTRARQMRVKFTEPYLRSGLVIVARTADAPRLDTLEKIKNEIVRVGVMSGTTADTFVQNNLPSARRVTIAQRADVAFRLLKTREIAAYIDDCHAASWLVSENEGSLVGIWKLLTEEQLACALRPEDVELLTAVNNLLKQWKQDGTLDRIVRPWLPYLDQLNAAPSVPSDGQTPPGS